MSGVFITFEGGDGSGKSTHARVVAERLEKEGHDVLLTREPGDTHAGKIIREVIIEHDLDPRAELFLFLADRAEHVEKVIKPALEGGKIVICDRFSASTFAYQIGGRELRETDLVQAMDAFARGDVAPDYTVYLDIDPEEAIQRRTQDKSQENNRFDDEEIAFHERIRASFVEMAQSESWITIDTLGEFEANNDHIFDKIKKFCSNKFS